MSYHRVQLRTYQASSADAAVVVDVVAAADLPQAGQAGADLEIVDPGLAVELELVGHHRPGADQAHLAAHHVEQLRQLVQAGLAQKAADGRDPGIVLELAVLGPLGPGRRVARQAARPAPRPSSPTMVRNLKHGNSRPCRPTRVWAKITPPPSASRILAATSASSGARNSSSSEAATQVEGALDQLRPRPGQVVVDAQGQDVAREEVADPGVVDRQPLQGRDHVDVAVVEGQALDQPLAPEHLVELQRHHHVRLAEPARQLLGRARPAAAPGSSRPPTRSVRRSRRLRLAAGSKNACTW